MILSFFSSICWSFVSLLWNFYLGPLSPLLHQFIWLFCYYLHAFDINPSSDIWLASIFSHFIGYLFILLIDFSYEKFSIRCSPTCVFLLLLPVHLTKPKKSSPRQCQANLPCVFLYEFYDFSLRHQSIWGSFCI